MIHGTGGPAAARAAPNLPGVYFFYSDDRQLLYVGKSLNLKKRLGQHFPVNQSVRPLPTRQQVAAASTTEVSWVICGTELEALVLEDRFIKEHLPIANKRQKKFLAQQYIGISRQKGPLIRSFGVLEAAQFSGWEIYGPYSDRFFVDKLLAMADRYVERLDPSGWTRASLDRLKGFLSGWDNSVLAAVEDQMQRDAAALRFEQAQRRKEHLDFCSRYLERRRFVHRFSLSDLVIEHRNGAKWVFNRGLFFEDEKSGQFPPRDAPWLLPDRAHLVASWIRTHQNDVTYQFLATEPRRHGEVCRETTGSHS